MSLDDTNLTVDTHIQIMLLEQVSRKEGYKTDMPYIRQSPKYIAIPICAASMWATRHRCLAMTRLVTSLCLLSHLYAYRYVAVEINMRMQDTTQQDATHDTFNVSSSLHQLSHVEF